MKIIACVLFAAALCGCNTTPTKTEVVTVEKLVKVPCIKEKPTRPIYLYGKGDEPSDIEKGGILIKDFEAAEKYGQAWEAEAAGCIIAPPGKQ